MTIRDSIRRFLHRDTYHDLVGNRLLWHTDRVALESRDLAGMTHIIASRNGLFVANATRWKRIAEGQYFGITYHNSTLFCFQQLGPREKFKGRIIGLIVRRERIKDAYVAVKGLPSGIHQIDFVGDELFIIDTDHTRILKLNRDFDVMTDHRLFVGQPYPHINSIIARGGNIYILKHNGNLAPSEVACLDRDLNVLSTRAVSGFACHNLVFTRTGELLICDSKRGRLITPERSVVTVDDMFVRGLSVNDDSVVVGGNSFCDRGSRRHATGRLFFYDASFRLRNKLDIPGGPTEIRRIDGDDRSLSNAYS